MRRRAPRPRSTNCCVIRISRASTAARARRSEFLRDRTQGYGEHGAPPRSTVDAQLRADELRLFAKPEPIHVTMTEVPHGPPLRFRWRRVQHVVVSAEGPERIAMEWWRSQDSMPTRDYFRIEDDQGRRFWLYRDGLYARETSTPNWFMHGVFA